MFFLNIKTLLEQSNKNVDLIINRFLKYGVIKKTFYKVKQL